MDGQSDSDYITIDNLRIHGKHGHYPHERSVEQEFDVSLLVSLSTMKASLSDKLADSLDYDYLKGLIEGVFKKKSKYLIEALAEDIARQILQDLRVLEVTVHIKKVAVWKEGVPGVKITRKRP